MRRVERAGFSPLWSMALAGAILLAAGARAVTITYGPLAAAQEPPGGGPPTSIVAYWRTDVATATNIAYVGESPTGPWVYTGSDAAVGTRHAAVVTGLSGERTYYLYVESDGVPSGVVEFHTSENLLVNGSFETWHTVSEPWGTEEPDGWEGWEIYPWTPPGSNNPDHIAMSMDRPTGIPTPLTMDGDHRIGMDEGWRSCYGGVYQEVSGLPAGEYLVSGWISYLFVNAPAEDHRIEILAKDGPHSPGVAPTGTEIFVTTGGSEENWIYVQGTVTCTSGTVTVYCNLRSDDWTGSTFAHFDGMRLVPAQLSVVQFSNFQHTRVISGNAYDITLTYDTAIPTTTQVDWGATPAYGNSTPTDPNLVTHHVVQLQGVAPEPEPYHWRAHATAPPDVSEYSRDQTFDAPLITFGGINSVIDWGTGTVCTISWTTNFPTTSNKVYYRESGSGTYLVAQDASDPTPRTSHSVVLSGLELGEQYVYYVESGGTDIIPSTSGLRLFETPVSPGPPLRLGMAMIGGSIPDGGDDVGPANEVQDMIERDHPMVNITGMPCTTWRRAQPEDPGDGPDVYDWSEIDEKADKYLPGKSLTAYYQIWGTAPDWVELDTPRYWEKFERFIEEMTVYINENFGPVYYVFENEPNISRAPEGWHWADWYIHCLEHFYPAVHRADARTGMQNGVIAGNLSGHSAGGFAELYARGLKNISDVLGYHAYPYDIRDGVCVEDLAQIHAIQVQYGDGDKKIWVSEGWGSGRSAGFDRTSPDIEPTALEIENMYLCMVKGWDNVMTPRENWHPDYLFGMKFFCGNDNWGAMNWRRRAIPEYDEHGNITGFIVDGYHMTPDIAPYFWNGGMMDFYGNSKDCLIHVFPGNGLVFMNPGFELRSEPPNLHLPHFWTPESPSASPDNYNLDDTVIHGGTYSLRLSQSEPGAKGVWQMTAKRSAIPGVQYRARVWCRTQDTSGLEAKFYIRFCNLDGTVKSPRYWAPSLTGTADWRRMEIVATAPAFTERVEVGCYIAGVGTAWFDDVTISMASQEEVGRIQGYTLDEGQIPVPFAIVRSTTGGIQAVSDENGYYEIHNVPTGTYDFVCRSPGYVPHRVRNQTVAAGKLTFVNFNMRNPHPGLTVTSVACDAPSVPPGGEPVAVTVTVENSTPYPNILSEVNVFVEEDGEDATGLFQIRASESNPKVIAAGSQAQFQFTLIPKPEAQGRTFSVNAYAFGQEDRPNMLENGGFDDEPWDHHWSFTGGASPCIWEADSTDYHSPPRSLKNYVADDRNTFNWANNYSAWGPTAVPAQPGRNYTVGAYHKDSTSGSVARLLFIQEYYYDGENWYYNGRRFMAVPPREVWAHDVMTYQTGSPEINPGLYPTNRLVVSCGPATGSDTDYSYNWWDDLYLKETGDWLADDRADEGAPLEVLPPQSPAGFYRAGWNLTSVPVEPLDPEASAVFADLEALGNVIESNLYRYEPGVGYAVYPGDFVNVALGRGYWLKLSAADGGAVVDLPGTLADPETLIPLAEGWNLIGHPRLAPVPLAACTLTNGAQVKTVSEAEAAGWIQGTLFYYDGSAYRSVALSGGDDDHLRPWYGYWLKANVSGLALSVPEP